MQEVNDYLDEYNNKLSPFTRFLWWCAGADQQILKQCPMYDRVKYAGIGGIIFATGFLATISGGYAFYVILSQKNGAQNDSLDLFACVAGIILGIVWGMIVFNMDRFIISSTGKSENEKIEWKEFWQAIPRIIIALVLGICIAAPLETRIMKTEISAKLQIEQEEYLADLNEKTNYNFSQQQYKLENRQKEINTKIDSISSYLEKRRLENEAQSTLLEKEAAGEIPGTKAGKGPQYEVKKEHLNKMEIAFEERKIIENKIIKDKQQELNEISSELNENRNKQKMALNDNNIESDNYDGLIRRIDIAHDISLGKSIMITLMLLSIELGPIFFKMMLSKGVYEYLSENKKRKIEAANGILKDESLVEGIDGSKHAEKTSFLEVEKMIAGKKQLLNEQQKLDQQVIKSWAVKKQSDIDTNPEGHYTEK